MIDLHMHSIASDGSDSPEAIVGECARQQLSLNAITDHDNIDAQAHAIRESGRLGRRYLTGIEISVTHTGELHILGYGMDIGDPAFVQMMESLRKSRIERILCIIEELKACSVDVTLEDVKKQAAGMTLGRPHVALALAAKGYSRDYHEAFSKYLDQGGLCYVQRRLLDPRQAIELIRSAGGLPVLAHPGLVTTDDLSVLVSKLTDWGLAGMEAYYPAHSDAQVTAYCALAARLGLLVTAGSDCHGIYRDRAIGCERRSGPMLEESSARMAELAV